MRRKNAARRRKYCHVVVSSWTIKHFDFQKLVGLSLAYEVVNDVWIYGSKVAEGFSGSNVGLVIDKCSVFLCPIDLIHPHYIEYKTFGDKYVN